MDVLRASGYPPLPQHHLTRFHERQNLSSFPDRLTASLLAWLGCNILDQIFDSAVEVRAQTIKRIGADVRTPIQHSRQGDAPNAGDLRHLRQGDAPTLLELFCGDALLELKPEH